jgi:hypothetical protein
MARESDMRVVRTSVFLLLEFKKLYRNNWFTRYHCVKFYETIKQPGKCA